MANTLATQNADELRAHLARIVAAYDSLLAAELAHPQKPSNLVAARSGLDATIDDAARAAQLPRR